MITEDYVNFETAKLLKEKGFDEGCSFVVNAVSKGVMPVSWPTTNSEIEDDKADLIALPTLQMAMKWLRVNYNIHIEPRYFPMPNIYRYVIIHSPATIENIDSHPQYFNSHEEACETAIKYCLENLI